MPNAVIMTRYGPPEVLEWAQVPRPEPRDGQIRIKVRAADFGVTLSEPTPDRAPGALEETIALLAGGRLRLRAHTSMPMQQAAEAHRQLEGGTVHQRIILTLP
jgi:NADPH:quinone reductase-like Zn-dependent oxidoreductase